MRGKREDHTAGQPQEAIPKGAGHAKGQPGDGRATQAGARGFTCLSTSAARARKIASATAASSINAPFAGACSKTVGLRQALLPKTSRATGSAGSFA